MDIFLLSFCRYSLHTFEEHRQLFCKNVLQSECVCFPLRVNLMHDQEAPGATCCMCDDHFDHLVLVTSVVAVSLLIRRHLSCSYCSSLFHLLILTSVTVVFAKWWFFFFFFYFCFLHLVIGILLWGPLCIFKMRTWNCLNSTSSFTFSGAIMNDTKQKNMPEALVISNMNVIWNVVAIFPSEEVKEKGGDLNCKNVPLILVLAESVSCSWGLRDEHNCRTDSDAEARMFWMS